MAGCPVNYSAEPEPRRPAQQQQQQQQPTQAQQIQTAQAQIAGQQQMFQQNPNEVLQGAGVGAGPAHHHPQMTDGFNNAQHRNSLLVPTPNIGGPPSGGLPLEHPGPPQQGGDYGGLHPPYPQPPMGLQMPVGQGPFYGPASNPMFRVRRPGPSKWRRRNVTTTSIHVDGRITDTEIKLKVSGELPLWFKQKRAVYTKHMLHLFFSGVCAFIAPTHIYFLKVLEVDKGESPKHIRISYSQVMFVKLEGHEKKGKKGKKGKKPNKSKSKTKGKSPQPHGSKDHLHAVSSTGSHQPHLSAHSHLGDHDPNITFYSQDAGDAFIKTGNKGETHVLMDHFGIQKRQPANCVCKDPTIPCKCFVEARRVILEDPSAYLQFTGTSG
ncbi:hypothetical protein BV898_09822 [Hypsibius exemplaris]|uniref:Uncharacterized protein n=1 Tax=Hypsibius exemplaris TaxID=2072580 RepID=A0A1W0WLJ3_HYPEX|nr:hypothetical protein BV898_09822 [Hypsibius exemplaris]